MQIKSRLPRDENHLYAKISIEAMSKAVRLLNGSALSLWLYINKNQDGFKIELSQKACADFGIKKDSYYKAVKELCNNNYLVPNYVGSNVYYFYENGDGVAPSSFCEIDFSEDLALSEK